MVDLPAGGVTAETPKKILLGAGTIHKGLEYDSTTNKWNFAATLVGATSGGNKFSIVPEIYQPEIDGAAVKIKGLEAKVAETATMEVGFIELTKEIIKASIIGQDGTFANTNWDLIESKQWMEESDYWDNVAFVGRTFKGVPIIIIMENALMTSGLELNPKNKESVNGTYVFECHQEITGNLSKLPYHIYVPSATAEVIIDE